MNYKKNKKINKDIVLVGFQTYEYSQYEEVKESIEGLDFEKSIDKLESLGVGFKPFYKNENYGYELEEGKERYFYIIKIENNEQIF